MNPNYLDFEQPIADLEAKIQELRNASAGPAVNVEAEVHALQDKLRVRTAQIFRNLTSWQVLQLARHPSRPYTADYIRIICDEFQELAGDRAFADAQLANREREVLRLYAAGLPLKAVAERLGISYNTAKENITRIRVKYIEVGRPAPTKIDLLHRAIEDGLVDGRSRDDAHDDLAAR